LRREEEARRAEAEARATAEAARRTEAEARARRDAEAAQRAAAEAARRAEAAARARRDAEAAQRAAAEATRRAEVEKRAAADAARRAEAERRDAEDAARRAEAERQEAEQAARRAEAERQEAEQTARRAEAERRAAAEAARRAEADKREAEERARREAEDEAHRARDAEEKAAGEADARRRLETELERLRVQLDEERRAAEQRIQSVLERAAAEEQAAEELRRIADDETRREAEEAERRREEEEENLRRAIESARTEMEALRRRTDEEARRREEAEAELRRIAEEAAREPVAFPFPDDVAIATRPAPAEASEDAARRRVAALRGRELDQAPAPPSTAAWLGAVIPDLEEHQNGAAIDREAAHPERSAATGGAKSRDASAPERSRGTPPELRSGTLSDLPAPRLLALAARAKVSGRIDFQGEAARSLYLEDGRVVGATSGDPSDRVEELALRFGLLTRDQHRQLAAAAASLPSRRAALLLLERGFLKPTELTGLVRRRAEEVVFGLFAEPAARFRWVGAAVPPEERIALERGPLALAVEGVRRRWLAARVDDVLGGPGTLLVPAEGGPPVTDLGLSAEERRAVALADGLRTLDEIVAASPLDALSTRQVLAALVLVDALRVRLLQGGRPAAAATAAIDLARVREKLDQARRADYFTILGIGRLCTPHEAR
ncbi:MAG TPA: DUF4388 domain-containing protein, partial [Anaeromyxobacter sp.]|nr:DUF4388 domain-containing protein [Anaeromyxobacter sp.]